VTLKVVPKASYDSRTVPKACHENVHWRIKIDQGVQESRNINLMRPAVGTISRISKCKEASRTLMYIFLLNKAG
jgi:hypothetical protein